jgi:hypothetical protein
VDWERPSEVISDPNPYYLGPYYMIRWEWLTFPVVLQVISIAFVISVAIAMHRNRLPLSKASTLAVFLQSVKSDRHDLTLDRASGMDTIAKTTRVRLVRKERVYRLTEKDDEV